MQITRFLLSLIILFPAFSAFSYASTVFELLTEAEALKTTAPADFNVALSKIEKNNPDLTREESLYLNLLKGYKLAFSGEVEKAFEVYRKVITQAENTDLKAKALYYSINLHGLTRNVTAGFGLAQELIAILNQVSNSTRFNALAALAIFYNQNNEFALGEKAAKEIRQNATEPRLLCIAAYAIIEAQINRSDKESIGFDEAVEQCEVANESLMIQFIKVYQAINLRKNGDLDSALKLLLEYESRVKQTNYPWIITLLYSELAEVSYRLNQIDSAIKYARIVLANPGAEANTSPKVQALFVLAESLEQKGDLENALAFYKKYSEANNNLLNKTKALQLAIQQAKNSALERANQIKILDKENSLLKTEAELSKTEIENNRLVIATLLLLASVVLIWLLVNRKMQTQLKHQARTDELTGIANRNYFTQLAVSSLGYHEKTQQVLTLVVFDLDFFKKINDSYGHLVGDWALKAVVEAVQSVVRTQDVVGRLGGEEFGILLPGCSVTKANAITEKCRDAIATIDTSPSGEKFTITASFGVADTQNCGYKFETLYASADQALYRSKNEGRNRVFVFAESPKTAVEFTEQFN